MELYRPSWDEPAASNEQDLVIDDLKESGAANSFCACSTAADYAVSARSNG